MNEPFLFRVEVSQTGAEELEESIRNAFAQSGKSFPVGTISYTGPAPGSFGFGQGFLELIGGAWSELMKIPDAVKILAHGIADYLRLKGSTQTVVFEVNDGKITGSFKATGSAIAPDPVQIAKALSDVLQKSQSREQP